MFSTHQPCSAIVFIQLQQVFGRLIWTWAATIFFIRKWPPCFWWLRIYPWPHWCRNHISKGKLAFSHSWSCWTLTRVYSIQPRVCWSWSIFDPSSSSSPIIMFLLQSPYSDLVMSHSYLCPHYLTNVHLPPFFHISPEHTISPQEIQAWALSVLSWQIWLSEFRPQGLMVSFFSRHLRLCPLKKNEETRGLRIYK